MSELKGCTTLAELIDKIQKYHPDADIALVERAWNFAEKAHADQLRKSGEP